MVGAGGERSKEAMGSRSGSGSGSGMMALHEALRTLCFNSDWTYSVFWTLRPRPRVRGGNGCKVGDDNGSLLMGKVASDKCHKWVFKEPSECEPNMANYWQSSFDALPPEWNEQFESGIETIAVIQAGHGLLQLGSCKIIPEDLHFVLRMRHTFESLGYQSGFYLSQLFSSTKNASSSASIPTKQPGLPLNTPPLFNWGPHHMSMSSPASMLAPPNFQRALGFPPAKDEPHMFLMPYSAASRMDEIMGEHESDMKWHNGLSFFNALTGRADEAKLLFSSENLGHKPDQGSNREGSNLNMQGSSGSNPNEFLSLDNHQEHMRKNIDNKFKRSCTLPARMASPTFSTSIDHHPQEFRNPEAGLYSDVMETYLE